ncbi:hypothetical protein D1627_14565 [Pontibacter oryzae]|uniref:DUF3575 domain-containing protein n=1 Tax=Pontibacter oryzae TaxID=2304593 RepID=A0A399S3J0_9BACT|nr:hypothetical protein D1627_14565 [Pontibacter oryzae]
MSFIAKAQDTLRHEPPTARQDYKIELSADVMWLINDNLTPTVLLKIHKNLSNTAYRLRLGADYTEHINAPGPPTHIYPMSKTHLELFVSVGKEWQLDYDNFRINYGADLYTNYWLYRSEHQSTDAINFLPRQHNLELGLSPFIGAQYFVHKNISLALENHFRIGYNQEKISYVNNDNQLDTSTTKFLKAKLLPLHTISLNFHF